MLLCDRLAGILLLPSTRNHVTSSGLSKKEHSIEQLLPYWQNKHLPSFNVLPVLPVDRRFVQQSSYRSPVLKKWHTWRCQPVTLVREPFSSVLPFSQKVGSMKRVSFAILKVEKAWVWQTPQTLCWEEPSFLIHRGLPRILSLPGITLTLPVPSKNEQRIEQILTCWKNHSSMSFRSCQLKGQWFSNPVHISITLIASTKQRSHMQVSTSHHCERTILSKVAIFERVRSMQSVSFAMLKVDKFGRHRRPCVKKILWLLMPSSDGLQESTHYRESNNFGHAGCWKNKHLP